MDNLVSLVLYMCPEQNELKCVTQTCSSSLLPKLGKYLDQLRYVLYQGPQKAYVSAGGIEFALLTENLTLKVWTENWKGVNTILLV